ncbi:hypothetical protein J2X32_001224 [Rheinheimera pacifica]|uniref:thermostable hemolysin n=1 Tax=Rheinheimera pacifica TaxID=173990 RepID=UPI00285889C5|nr:thermostable hemolysin [Rheinheimera pacifica]MDR6982606.1 hypothetical protein [Rheinheimera pacifica]
MTSLLHSAELSGGTIVSDGLIEPAESCLLLVSAENTLRGSLQQFIQEGFATHFQAKVQYFMPHLLGVSQAGQWQAVLGIRFAAGNTLFTEQYLGASAQQVMASYDTGCQRADIAEIGHLYACSSHALMQLFVLMLQALHQLQLKYLLFAATNDLNTLLTRHGLNLIRLAEADPACLGSKAADWGSYYQREPAVYMLSVAQAASRIHSDRRLQHLIFRHWPQLHILVDNLRGAC